MNDDLIREGLQMSLKRVILILICFLMCSTDAFAQKHAGSQPFNRLSLTLAATYHRNPWKGYNHALEIATRQVELDNFFLYPTGYYEKINGDVSFNGTIGFQITKRLSILLNGLVGQMNSGFEFYADSSMVPPGAGASPAFQQQLDFSIHAIGIGVSYEYAVGNDLTLLPQVVLERYYGQLDLNWRHTRSSRGPIQPDNGDKLSASLDNATWGVNLGIALDWKFHENLSFLVGLDYRMAEFDRMRGPATYGYPGFNDFFPFEGELVQAVNFFGVRDLNENSPDKRFFMPPLNFLTEPGTEARKIGRAHV